MWDSHDLTKSTLDKCCNVMVIFEVRKGRLNMTVFNRSNDIWWGAYGANAVHFSILQEFVAYATNNHVGEYRQVSNNFHLYTHLYNAMPYLDTPPAAETFDYYSLGKTRPHPLMVNSSHKLFLSECEMFCSDPFNARLHYANDFFEHVAKPMAMVSCVRKAGAGDGRAYASKIKAEDWRKAVLDWIDRREAAKLVKEEKPKFDLMGSAYGKN